jgi:hypothetical protein
VADYWLINFGKAIIFSRYLVGVLHIQAGSAFYLLSDFVKNKVIGFTKWRFDRLFKPLADYRPTLYNGCGQPSEDRFSGLIAKEKTKTIITIE